jgi:hypothetical protein
MNKFLFICLFLVILSIRVNAQATSSASARATIVEPVTITKAAETSMGTVAIIIAGTIEVIPAKIPRGIPNINLPVNTGTFTAATFMVEGNASYAYTITVPSSPLEVKSSNGPLVVNSFISDPNINSSSGLSSGVYVSVTPLNLTVNYN